MLGGATYTVNQASYDLARLRLKELITRIPAKNRYRLTDDGRRFAIFYTKVHDRLLRPPTRRRPTASPTTDTKSVAPIDIHITETIDQARLLPKTA